MQKVGILNSSIAKVLADLGHTDKICVGDCGLPVPAGVQKIDLALRLGEPPFIEVIKEMAKYMQIEKIYLAPETKIQNPAQWKALQEVFPESEVEWVMLESHEELKAWEKDCSGHQDRRNHSFLQCDSPVRSHLLREVSESTWILI